MRWRAAEKQGSGGIGSGLSALGQLRRRCERNGMKIRGGRGGGGGGGGGGGVGEGCGGRSLEAQEQQE